MEVAPKVRENGGGMSVREEGAHRQARTPNAAVPAATPPAPPQLAPQVNAAGFEPAAYTDSLAAAARGKQARFEQLATAPAPYASTSDEAERFAGFQDKHLRPRGREVADKVRKAQRRGHQSKTGLPAAACHPSVQTTSCAAPSFNRK